MIVPLWNAFFMGSYSLLWRLARPVLRRHKRLREDFSLRLVPDEWKPEAPVDLWIQAASGGESFLTRQLLRELHSLLPATPSAPFRVLCTSCTRQGLEVLERAATECREEFPGLSVSVRVFPLDEPGLMRRALAFASPKALVLLETELWPGLMHACAAKHIPILLVNGRMTEKSYKSYSLFSSVLQRIAPKLILATAQSNADRFSRIFPDSPLSLMPNMKFDGLVSPAAAIGHGSSPERLLEADCKLILLASVRKEEEELLFPLVSSLQKQSPQVLIVIAPRHMERVLTWKKLLGSSALLRSEIEARGRAVSGGSAVIWDSFGELRALYARADVSFVGGSLVPLGGQNFLECAGQGKVPVIGPYWDNFLWVGEEFFSAGLGIRVSDVAELQQTLLDRLQTVEEPSMVRGRLQAYLESHRGGTAQAAQAVIDSIQ